jgi:hypothetical protein
MLRVRGCGGSRDSDSPTLDTIMLMEGMDEIQVIRAPGALACLGSACPTLVRRRR